MGQQEPDSHSLEPLTWCQVEGCSAPAQWAALLTFDMGVVMGLLACHAHADDAADELNELADASTLSCSSLLLALS